MRNSVHMCVCFDCCCVCRMSKKKPNNGNCVLIRCSCVVFFPSLAARECDAYFSDNNCRWLLFHTHKEKRRRESKTPVFRWMCNPHHLDHHRSCSARLIRGSSTPAAAITVAGQRG